MPERSCYDLPDLVKTAIPLPWTTDGPNDHSKPQQMASISLLVSVADPIFYIKYRVINMKQLDAIKKRLPPGIDLRISSKNVITFRVRFRRKGYPDLIHSFPVLLKHEALNIENTSDWQTQHLKIIDSLSLFQNFIIPRIKTLGF